MSAYDPRALPPWEIERGDGPATRTQRLQDELEARAELRARRLLDPAQELDGYSRTASTCEGGTGSRILGRLN
jgi:hypothetical protein